MKVGSILQPSQPFGSQLKDNDLCLSSVNDWSNNELPAKKLNNNLEESFAQNVRVLIYRIRTIA